MLSIFIRLVALLFFAQVGAVVASPQEAAAEAKLSIEQYNNKSFGAAYEHMAKAAKLAPDSEDYQVDAAILSELAGRAAAEVLPFYRRATELASQRKDYEAVQVYNRKILKLAEIAPSWVAEKLEAATKGAVSEAWQAEMDQLNAYIQQKKFDKAAEQGQKVVDQALAQLGAGHPATLEGQSRYAYALYSNGAAETAFKVLMEAEVAATESLGEHHPQTQQLQMLNGDLQQRSGNYQSAAALYRKALAAYDLSLGAGHPSTLDAGQRLATIEELRGEYDAAADALLISCVAAGRTLGELHIDTGECYRRLGLMNFRQGDYAKARLSYGKSSKILKGVAGKGHPSWVQTQVYRADLARVEAEFWEAEEIIRKVTEAEESPKNLKFEAKGVLAQLLEDQGLYPRAEEVTREILDYENETLGETHPNAITTLNNLAGLQRKQSRLIEAEEGYELALQRFSERLGETHPSTLAVMNNLALTLETEGLYDRAEPLYRKALKYSKEQLGEAHPTTVANMNNLALLYESQGTFDKAEPLYKQTIEILADERGAGHPDTIAVKNNLGYLYLLQERNEDAVGIFEEVVDNWEATLGEDHQKFMKALNNLGRVTHNLKDYDAAEEMIGRALDLRIRVLGENHMDVIRSRHDLGKLYMDMDRLEEALELLQKTLKQAEENLGEQHPYTFETLNTLALLQLKMEDNEAAFNTQQTIFVRRNIFLDQMLWATSENAREGYIRLHRPELNRYMAMIAELEPEQAGRELMRVSLNRKGLLLQVSSQIHQVTKMADDPALTAISDELMQSRKDLAALTLSGPTEGTAVSFLEKQYNLKERISELEGELGRASLRFKESAEKVTLQSLEESLPEDSALVDYMIFRDAEDTSKLQVSLLKKQEGEVSYDHYLYEDLAAINESIDILREVIQDEFVGPDELMEMGMETFGQVWSPLVEKLAEIPNIYVVPDGMLNILPFNAMVTEDEEYLLAAVDLHTISSSRNIIPSDIPVAKGGYMIMAGPDYDTDEVTGKKMLAALNGKRSAAANNQAMRGMAHGMRGLSFAPLPGAEEEGRQIKEQIAEAGGAEQEAMTQLIQKKAAQEELLRKMEPPEVLHISTHGFFLKPNEKLKKRLSKLTRGAGGVNVPPPGDNPLMRAGLAFAGLNANAKLLGEIDTDNDGVLTALEALGLNLTGTRLAILSACETGLGEIHEGEGVYGLRRSFQEAGAGAVVNSLWEVSDAGTQALMNGLYQRVLEGEDVHAALRNTQLEMAQSDEWSHPYIWSAFFMVEGAIGADSEG